MGCLNVSIRQSGYCLAPEVSRTGTTLNVSCGIVCGIGIQRYLYVLPEAVQWISEHNNVTYQVESNTNWNAIVLNSHSKRLEVSPTDIQIIPDSGQVVYSIKSDTTWHASAFSSFIYTTMEAADDTLVDRDGEEILIIAL